MAISIQTADFDVGLEVNQLRNARKNIGAVVFFVGYVRDLSTDQTITHMILEHYPGMTEKSLEAIINQAKNRWDIIDASVIHRVGTLYAGEQIVLVAVCGAHRREAFLACEFIMDYLKTDAPFWKKEVTPTNEFWVEAKTTDDDAKARWSSENMTK